MNNAENNLTIIHDLCARCVHETLNKLGIGSLQSGWPKSLTIHRTDICLLSHAAVETFLPVKWKRVTSSILGISLEFSMYFHSVL